MLAPRLRKIADTLQAVSVSSASGKDNDAAGAEMAISVGAMANVSKGFKPVVASEVEARFFQVRDGRCAGCLLESNFQYRTTKPIIVQNWWE